MRRVCAEVAHLLHFGIEEMMELEITELLAWHSEAIELAKHIYRF